MDKLTFYHKLSNDNLKVSKEFFNAIAAYQMDINYIMSSYFKNYWEEFQKFWNHEEIDWISFALIPHNAIYFVQYVFEEYPEVLNKVKQDLKATEIW